MKILQKTDFSPLLGNPLVLALALGLCSLLPCSAHAGSDCDGTTLQIIACLEREHRELDSSLKNLYSRVLHGLASSSAETGPSRRPSARELLMSSQKAWLDFREQECKARQSYFSEGSMGKMELLGCWIELTRDRVRFLENWLELLER